MCVCERERERERERETESGRERDLLASAMKWPASELGCRATEKERKMFLMPFD